MGEPFDGIDTAAASPAGSIPSVICVVTAHYPTASLSLRKQLTLLDYPPSTAGNMGVAGKTWAHLVRVSAGYAQGRPVSCGSR